MEVTFVDMRDTDFLAGDGGKVTFSTLECLGVEQCLTDTHVHHDLLEAGNHHHVRKFERTLDLCPEFVVVPGLQSRLDLGAGAHSFTSGISAPVRLQTRTLVPSSRVL